MNALIVGLMLLAAAVPALPFTSYSDVPGVRVVGPACMETVPGVTRLSAGGGQWTIVSSQTRDVFVHISGGMPDYVYFVVGSGDPIKVRNAMTFDEAKARYPDGVCSFFAEKDS